MPIGNHEHTFVDIVRRSGNKVRRQCVCASIGPWVKVLKDTTPIPSNNPVVLRASTLQQLRKLARTKHVRGAYRMSKAELIEALTEVQVT